MTHENLSENLLMQNGIEPASNVEKQLAELKHRIAATKRSANRTNALAIAFWVLAAASWLFLPRLLILIYGPEDAMLHRTVMGAAGVPTMIFFIAAVIYTIIWYARWRSANMMEFNGHLLRMQAQLEELLREKRETNDRR
jgi:hypothetical protein